MIRKKVGEIEFLQFELFSDFPELIHGVFLKHGGVSTPPFSSLNIGGTTSDPNKNIQENKKRILEALQIKHCISVHQKHSKTVKSITSLEDPGEADGMITSLKEVALLIKHADCQAAIFYDPIHQAIANIHAGWRGTVLNIYRETLKTMKSSFGSRPEDIFVAISPSLGPNHSEFKNYKTEFPQSFWDFQIRPNYFNLWEIARFQLETEGILPHHIQIASLCTYTEENDFFSHRRESPTGRNATLVQLNKTQANQMKRHFLRKIQELFWKDPRELFLD